MFVVTRDGVIATDPVAYGRPEGAVAYLQEIRKVTKKVLFVLRRYCGLWGRGT